MTSGVRETHDVPASTAGRVVLGLGAALSTVVALIGVAFGAFVGLWALAAGENGDSTGFVLATVAVCVLLIAAPVLLWTGFGLAGRSRRRGWILAGIGILIDALLLAAWLVIAVTA